MAGTLTLISDDITDKMITKRYRGTSHTDGSLSDITFTMTGYLCSVVTNPSATAPTDNWDLTILDVDGVDILNGAGVDRDTTNSEMINLMAAPIPVSGLYTITGANMGSAKIADVVLRIRP